MTEKQFYKTYTIELRHEDIRREAENYINQAKALGFKINGGFGDLNSYVQLIAIIAQIEHNNRVERVVND